MFGRTSRVSHSERCNRVSVNSEGAMTMISDSVIDPDVADCLLHVHANRKKEFGPAVARKPPDVDFVSS